MALLLALALAFSAALIVGLNKTLYGKGVRALMQSPVGAQLVADLLARLFFGALAVIAAGTGSC